MQDKPVCIVTVENGVMTVRLNRPEDANRITTQSMQAIIAAVHQADEDPAVRSIVLCGDKQNFCCGGRVDPAATKAEKDAYSAAIIEMQEALRGSRVPILAAVEGDCLAGGNDLLACSDIAIARKGVHFGFPEITYGAFPVMVMVNTVDVIPQKRLLPYFYTGDLFDADTALSFGMLTEVVEEEDFWPTVQRYTRRLAESPAQALAIGRRAYLGMCPLSPKERVAYGNQVLREVWKEQAASGKTY